MATSPQTVPDSELKARHRAMWASGDYPSMVETWLLPLGPRLTAACDIGPGTLVLDVGAGTGNASLPAARRGAHVIASDLTPELLVAGRARAGAEGAGLRWTEGDAAAPPLGAAPRGARRRPAPPPVRRRLLRRRHVVHRRDVRPPPRRRRRRARARLPARRHDRAAELDARRHDRRAVPHHGPVRAAAPARRAAAAAVGRRGARARAARRPRGVPRAGAQRARG